eukprot:scaffold20576_cov27-Tisochrysis_lutea.AAC.2
MMTPPPMHRAQPTRSRARKPSPRTSAAMKAFDRTETAPSGAMREAGAKPSRSTKAGVQRMGADPRSSD